MKKLIVIAALALISSTSADAATREFKFGGRTVRVEMPKNCKKISCMSLSEKEKSSRRASPAISTSSAAPAAAAGTVAAATAAAATVARRQGRGEAGRASSVTASVVRSEPKTDPQADERRSVARLSLPSNTVEEAKRTPGRRRTRPAAKMTSRRPAKAGNSPLGVWVTEKNAGRVRIEECGSQPVRPHGREGWFQRQEGADRHETVGQPLERSHQRRAQRQDLRLPHVAARRQRAAGRGLRLRRPVLRRRDLEARRVSQPLKAPQRDARPRAGHSSFWGLRCARRTTVGWGRNSSWRISQ